MQRVAHFLRNNMTRDKLYTTNSLKFKKTQQAILTLICNQAMTKHELAQELDLNLSTINNYIYFMKQKGLVYIASWQENQFGKATARYQFGTNEDEPFVGRRKYKSPTRSNQRPVNLKMPRCDIAASWLNNPIGN